MNPLAKTLFTIGAVVLFIWFMLTYVLGFFGSLASAIPGPVGLLILVGGILFVLWGIGVVMDKTN